MRILQIITQGELGGAQKNVLDTSAYLSANNNVFIAIGATSAPSDTWLLKEAKRANLKSENLFIVPALVREVSPLKDFRAFYEVYKLVKKIKPHIVHVHSSKAGVICGLAAKIAGSCVVYTVHGFVFSEPSSALKKSFFILIEFIASFFRDLTITVSEFDRELGRKFFIIRKNKNILIYNGIDIQNEKNILPKDEARSFILEKIGLKHLSGTSNPRIVGTVANLYKTKGIKYLIESAKIVNDNLNLSEKILFVVFGEGELRHKLTEEIAKNNLEEIFFLPGLIPNAYIYLRGFDLFTLPSIKEGFPYALLEVILAKIPFIATDVGGISEILKYAKGRLIPAGNAEALANAITLHFSSLSTDQITLPDIFSSKNSFKLLSEQYSNIMKKHRRC
ncbi:MAG: glycosyltransferase [Patescibacteria group bacterium]|nr:glycosyltransferase [Patescibacteria group bacterium]